jgi:hypothetical protein
MSERTWKTDTSSVEIRTNGTLADGMPALNEILAQAISFHLKRQYHGGWWLEFVAGGRDFHIDFDVSNGALSVSLCDRMANEYWKGETRDISILYASDDAIHPIFLDEDEAGFLMTEIAPEHTGLPFYVWIPNRGPAKHDIRIWASPDIRSSLSDRTCLAIQPDVRVLSGKLDYHDLNLLRRWVAPNLSIIEKYWDGEIDSPELYETNRPIRL